MNDELEPGLRAFHERTSSDYAQLAGDGYKNIIERRAVAELVRKPWCHGGPAMAFTETLQIGFRNTRIRIYLPVIDGPLPALLYLHGGGWTIFSIDTHDRLMREYAARSGCAVVGVDYSLSPEVRFPHALEELDDVWLWLHDNATQHGLDASRIAIGGDSAGANLAVSSALRLRDAGKSADGLLLNYGAFDTVARPSHTRYDGEAFMLTIEEMREFWNNYLGPEAIETSHPHARPLLADLHGLPPAFLCIAECDILADENHAMAARLAAAEVDVTANLYTGATHSFLEAVKVSPTADRALSDGAAWLAARLKRQA